MSGYTLERKFPIGSILMYDEADWVNNETIPGWYLCDGSCGTPNLIDRFVMGGTAVCAGSFGGCNTIVATHCHGILHNHAVAHSHDFCDHCHAMESHTHTNNFSISDGLHYHGFCVVSSCALAGTQCPRMTAYNAFTGSSSFSLCCGYHSHATMIGTILDTDENTDQTLCPDTSSLTCYQDSCETQSQSSCVSTSYGGADSRPPYYSIIFVKRME